jgi:hypothetical protein
MNCAEFRHRLLVDPRCADSDFLGHAQSCPQCAGKARLALEFENRLRSALQDEAQAGDRRHLSSPGMPGRHRWGLAAAGTLVLGLAVWLAGVDKPLEEPSALASSVLAHVNTEHPVPDLDRMLSADSLALLFAGFGARILDNGLEGIRYAVRCRIRHHDGLHLVLSGERGPVAVLLMPGEYLQGTKKMESSRFVGLMLPTPYGSMALVGVPGESLSPLAARVNSVVVWGG